MGCLFEILFEFIFELIFEGYMKLMTLVLPKRDIKDKTQRRIELFIKIFAVVLLISVIVGIFMRIFATGAVRTIGAYITVIPLLIIIFQVALGITVRINSKKGKK